MKLRYWFIAVAFLALVVVVVVLVRQKPGGAVDQVGASAGTVELYRQRLAELREQEDSLKAALDRRSPVRDIGVERRIRHVEAQVRELEGAIDRWSETRDEYGEGEALRDCIMLYGRAQSACEMLAIDTLGPEPVVPEPDAGPR